MEGENSKNDGAARQQRELLQPDPPIEQTKRSDEEAKAEAEHLDDEAEYSDDEAEHSDDEAEHSDDEAEKPGPQEDVPENRRLILPYNILAGISSLKYDLSRKEIYAGMLFRMIRSRKCRPLLDDDTLDTISILQRMKINFSSLRDTFHKMASSIEDAMHSGCDPEKGGRELPQDLPVFVVLRQLVTEIQSLEKRAALKEDMVGDMHRNLLEDEYDKGTRRT